MVTRPTLPNEHSARAHTTHRFSKILSFLARFCVAWAAVDVVAGGGRAPDPEPPWDSLFPILDCVCTSTMCGASSVSSHKRNATFVPPRQADTKCLVREMKATNTNTQRNRTFRAVPNCGVFPATTQRRKKPVCERQAELCL